MKRIALTAIGYSHGILPTVTIVRDGVHVRINECDYDPEVDVLADPVEPAPAVEPVAAPEPAPAVEPVAAPEPAPAVELLVMKSGGKFFITDKMGQKVEGEAAAALGIADTGYTTEAKAQAALVEATKA